MDFVRIAFMAVAAALLAGCTLSDSLRDDPVRSVWVLGKPQLRDVAFITDREWDDAAELGFDNHWSERVQCGVSRVAVPEVSPPGPDTEAAHAEKPEPVPCGDGDGFAAFLDSIAKEDRVRHCNSVFLYIHGYNVSFRSALVRGGQIASDTQWPCAMGVFSWGSEAKFDRYVADAERSGYAVPVLMELLRALGKSGVTTNIVAHSMGARLTLSALAALDASCAGHTALVNELILAAPDVNAEAYNDDFATLLKRAAPCTHRVTVYTSRNDMVLMLSQSIHGGIPRAGLDPENDPQYAKIAPNIDLIDASDAPGDPVGHGYFVSSYEMLDDMMWVLGGAEMAERATQTLPGKPTLVCVDACGGEPIRYKLSVDPSRAPGWKERFYRRLLANLLAIRNYANISPSAR